MAAEYSQPSAPMAPASMDPTNRRSKYQKNFFPESSKKRNLNLPHAGNYLHNIYIVLGIISNLEMI